MVRWRGALGACAGLALVSSTAFAPSAQAAQADRGPTYPSSDDVSAALSAVGTAQSQVAGLDTQLAEARATLSDLTDAAAVSDMAAGSARRLLEQRSTQSAAAQDAARTAVARADDADLTLSMYAAQVYQQGSGTLGTLDLFLGSGGPQDALDRASGIEAVGEERAHLLGEASATRLLADAAGRAAQEAVSHQHDAAAAAELAAAQARVDADRAATRTQQIQDQMRAVVVQLAALRQTSADLEQQRQAGLAAEEEARRLEAVRQAAIAAAQEAERQAAAQAAVRQKQAAAAELAARNAREAAAAAA
ncbi:MAG: hypothetical protein ABIW80_06570, partial [Lapillicoccus sp.]